MLSRQEIYIEAPHIVAQSDELHRIERRSLGLGVGSMGCGLGLFEAAYYLAEPRRELTALRSAMEREYIRALARRAVFFKLYRHFGQKYIYPPRKEAIVV